MMNFTAPNTNVTIVFPIADAVLMFNNFISISITNFAGTQLLQSLIDAAITLPSNTYNLVIIKQSAGTDTYVGEVSDNYTGVTW